MKNRSTLVAFCCGAFLALMLATWVLWSQFHRNSELSGQMRISEIKLDAWEKCAEFVLARLQNPSMAELPSFLPELVIKLGGAKFKVEAEVTFQDYTGEIVQNQFSCTVRWDMQPSWGRRIPLQWTLEQLNIE